MLIGTVAGPRSEVDLALMLGKRARVTGTMLRARPLEEKIAATRAFAKEVLPLFAQGTLKVVIDAEFGFPHVREAHERMESNESFGKIVLRMD